MCKTIYIAYDGDTAGINSAIRAGYTILKNNLEGKIINTPSGLDPDDWIQQHGAEPFENAIKNSDSIIAFHYKHTIDQNSSERDKIEFINQVIIELCELNDDLTLEMLVKELSYITNFKSESIFNSIAKIKNKKSKRKSFDTKAEVVRENTEKISLLDKELIMFCFSSDVENRMIIKKYMNVEWIQSELIKNLYNEIFMHLSSEKVVKPEIVMNELKNEDARNLMAKLLFNKIDVNKNMIIDCLIRMEKNQIQSQLNHLREQLKVQNLGDETQNTLLSKINELQKQKNDLKKKYEDA
jgi:DNA primase